MKFSIKAPLTVFDHYCLNDHKNCQDFTCISRSYFEFTGQQPIAAGEEMGLLAPGVDNPTGTEGQERTQPITGPPALDFPLDQPITRDMIPDIPVFTNEEEKMAFEETLNIDMTQVGNMVICETSPLKKTNRIVEHHTIIFWGWGQGAFSIHNFDH